MFSLRTGRTSEIHFELFRSSIHLPHKGRDEALAGLVAEYAGRLEHFCLRAPLQWFNFYDFWHLPAADNARCLPLIPQLKYAPFDSTPDG